MSSVFVVMNAVGYRDDADHQIDSVWINRESADARYGELKAQSDAAWSVYNATCKPYFGTDAPPEWGPYIVEYDAGLLTPKEHWQPRIP